MIAVSLLLGPNNIVIRMLVVGEFNCIIILVHVGVILGGCFAQKSAVGRFWFIKSCPEISYRRHFTSPGLFQSTFLLSINQ